MNEQIKQMIIKSIINVNITEAELEKLEQCSVHELMDIIMKATTSGESSYMETVHYLYITTMHYKQSGGSIHHEEGTIDV